MLDDKKDDIFLSRWINGDLSEEELREFKSHPEYEHYIKLLAAADALSLSEYNIDNALDKVKSNSTNTATKNTTKIIKLLPYAAIAASISIILGLFLFSKNETFTTSYGKQITVTLPDGSEMILNAKSEASFDTDNWETNRAVTLDGEAYFKVKKGNQFTVTTNNGDVTVLGTQFTVQSESSIFKAVCYEGKVQVTNNSEKIILTAGNAYRNITNTPSEHWNLEATEPSWIHHISTFRSTPIIYVFKELEEQYNITINTSQLDTSVMYTGTFPNNDKKVALTTVFSTLGMQYKILQDGKTVVVEK